MRSNSDVQNPVENVLATISVLPESERVDALLAYFATLLDSTDSASIQVKRDQMLERFAGCGGSFETGALVAKWIDCHLALRGDSRFRPAASTS